jgi:hypothetical protein
VYVILQYDTPQESPEPRTIVTGQQPLCIRSCLYLITLEGSFRLFSYHSYRYFLYCFSHTGLKFHCMEARWLGFFLFFCEFSLNYNSTYHCDYCKKDGHTEDRCFKRKKDAESSIETMMCFIESSVSSSQT